MFLSIHPVCCSPFKWTSLLTFSDLSKCLKYGVVKTRLLPKLSRSVSWQLPTSSPCPGQFTVLVTFWYSLPAFSPQRIFPLCACPCPCQYLPPLLELILALIISSFLLQQPLLQKPPVDFFVTSTTPLLPEKSFMFSKIIPYPWLPLFSAQSCISFSNYIRSQSLSTSLMWFLEHLLSLTLLCATPVFPSSYLNLSLTSSWPKIEIFLISEMGGKFTSLLNVKVSSTATGSRHSSSLCYWIVLVSFLFHLYLVFPSLSGALR